MSMKLQSFQGETSRRVAHSSSSQYSFFRAKLKKKARCVSQKNKNRRFGFIFINMAPSSCRVSGIMRARGRIHKTLTIELKRWWSHLHPQFHLHIRKVAAARVCVANDEDFFCWFIDVRNYRKEKNTTTTRSKSTHNRRSPIFAAFAGCCHTRNRARRERIRLLSHSSVSSNARFRSTK